MSWQTPVICLFFIGFRIWFVQGTWAQTSAERFSSYQLLTGSERVDSINAMPYGMMVENLQLAACWLKIAEEDAKAIADDYRVAQSSAKLGTVFYLQGKYDSSTYYNLSAISLFDKLQKPVKKAEVLCQLGYQVKRRDLNQGFEYFREAIPMLEQHNAREALMAAYDNFGVLYEMRDNHDSAYHFYQKALHLKEELVDSLGIPFSLNKIGQLYLLKKDFDTALAYFDKAYQMRVQRNDTFGIMENKTLYGDLFSAWEKWETALQWYVAANEEALRHNYPFLMEHNWARMASCYEQLGLYKQALDVYRKSVEVKYRLLNEKNAKTILELEQLYQSAEKDKNISRLETEAARKRLNVYIAIALAIILILIVIVSSINLQRKERAAKDAAIIAEREAGIKAVFEATEEERKRIAKDLHDGLGQQLSGLRMSWEGVQNQIKDLAPVSANKLQELTSVLDEACTEVRSISHTMMPRALQESGLLAAIEDMLHKSLHYTMIQYELQHYHLENKRFQERIELSMYRICQELIHNVIKHSKATHVSVQLLLNKHVLVMIVEDNGIGMAASHKSDGIGWRNIHNRVYTIGGEAMIEPGPEQGLVATVRIPVE